MLEESAELKDRIASRQKELESRIHQLKADSREKGREELQKLSEKLSELKSMISDGWDRLSNETAAKLNDWLDRDENDREESKAR